MRHLPAPLAPPTALQPYFQNLDHLDVKTITSTVPLRTFVSAMISYQPAWVMALLGVRGMFVRLLGMRQTGMSHPPRLTAATLPMAPGQHASIFTVRAAQDGDYWLADIDDQHLWAALAVIAEPLTAGNWRYSVATLVRYHNWAGPIYFNVIRPFHHLVVSRMAKTGARAAV